MSQVLSGAKSFSHEQGFKVAAFFNLDEREREYFLTLLSVDRAGTKEYENYLREKLRQLRSEAENLSTRLKHEKKLSPEESAVFYSDWVYSACRLSIGLGENTVPALARYLSLSEERVREVVSFLIKAGLAEKNSDGTLNRRKLSTHLEANSPWIKSHHRNWRLKAMDASSSKENLHYSAPMSLSKEDFFLIKEILTSTIRKVDDILIPSESEKLVCLNIDWFDLTPDEKKLR